MKSQSIKGYIFIILSAVIFGCMPLMARHIYAEGVDSLSLVLFRNILSLPLLAAIGALGSGGLKISPKRLPSLVIIGLFGCALTPLLLFSSYNYMASGAATVFHFIYPAAVVALELIFLGKKMKSSSAISLALCVVGIAMFYTPGAEVSLAGSVLALSSGGAYAVYIFLLCRFKAKGDGINGFAFAFYTSLSSVVILLPVCIFAGGIALPCSVKGLMLCLFFAVIINVGAVLLFQRGAFLVGGERAAILSTFEPITGLAVGYFAFGEPCGVMSIIGAALVISASVVIAVSDMRRERSSHTSLE